MYLHILWPGSRLVMLLASCARSYWPRDCMYDHQLIRACSAVQSATSALDGRSSGCKFGSLPHQGIDREIISTIILPGLLIQEGRLLVGHSWLWNMRFQVQIPLEVDIYFMNVWAGVGSLVGCVSDWWSGGWKLWRSALGLLIGKFHQFLYACLKNGTFMLRGMASVRLSITFFVSG